MMKTIVLGLGNTLLSDDGVGIYAMNELQKKWQHHDAIEFIDGGTLSFTLTDVLYEADNLIVIDAAQLSAAPGEVRVFKNEAMDNFVRNGKCSSVHEVSLSELMDMARLLETLPGRRVLLGVQPEKIDWGDQPTVSVKNAIPVICREADHLLTEWH